MDAFPPDRRRRDLDNTLKAVCDSLAHVGVYEDDSQIDVLTVRRAQVVAGGRLDLRVAELPLNRCPLCGGPWENN
jgi:crossover junction endodeoxyribonuclease RusA